MLVPLRVGLPTRASRLVIQVETAGGSELTDENGGVRIRFCRVGEAAPVARGYTQRNRFDGSVQVRGPDCSLVIARCGGHVRARTLTSQKYRRGCRRSYQRCRERECREKHIADLAPVKLTGRTLGVREAKARGDVHTDAEKERGEQPGRLRRMVRVKSRETSQGDTVAMTADVRKCASFQIESINAASLERRRSEMVQMRRRASPTCIIASGACQQPALRICQLTYVRHPHPLRLVPQSRQGQFT